MRRRVALVLAIVAVTAMVTPVAHLSAREAAAGTPSTAPRIATENGIWNQQDASAPVPAPRQAGAVAFDPEHDRMILFGGDGFGDTWSLSLSGPPTWTPINTAHTPGPREASVLVYDSLRKRMVLFGGSGGYALNDVWVLNLTGEPDWTQVNPAGPIPSGRMTAAGIYDPVRDRLLVFGGYPPEITQTEVWSLQLSDPPAWFQLSPSGGPPPARWGLSGVYDPEGDRFVILAGTGSAIPGYVDVWSLSLADLHWNLIMPSGTPPPARFIGTAVYEHGRQRVLLFGGYGATGPLADLWELGLGSAPEWTLLAPEGTIPAPRRNQMAVFDDEQSRMVMFGGLTDVAGFVNDLWALQFGSYLSPPEIDSFEPLGGPVGSLVTLHGHFLSSVTQVQFNSIPASIISVLPLRLQTVVPNNATTGRIRVTTNSGVGESATDFFVGSPPMVSSAEPDSGKSRTVVTITGHNFVGTTRVTFGGANTSTFSVMSDSIISAMLGATATTGLISVTNPAGTGVSSFDYHVRPPDPRPRVVSVRDVGKDQGGHVSLRWEASDLDEPSTGTITGYRVWRRAPNALASAARAGLISGSVASPNATDFWESIAELPSAFLAGYAYTASTPYDSTSDANPYTAFFVQALTADRYTFFSSDVDSGYSVDNLAPPQPTPFAASYSTSQVALHWGASRVTDFREFRLYRGLGPAFALDPANLIVATRDTSYLDVVPGQGNYSYKLVAADLHGNISRAAMVSPDTPVATLASLLSADATASRIRLAWYSGDGAGTAATVYRRESDGEWQSVAQVIGDGTGVIRYEDHAIVAGKRYGYRLGIANDGAEVYVGEVWLTAESTRGAIALAGAWPNPATGGRISVAFDLVNSSAATLELWDVAGRRVDRREVGTMGVGHHVAEFGVGSRLSPGIYLLRLSAGRVRLNSRVALID